ncbi:MAG: hypothetical protein M3O20_08805 [Acidobacteriota bacterium]|nr:hypothetical protein [Acidobacteriota bacterium]
MPMPKNSELLPVAQVGVGVKIQVAEHLRLRVQVRDYFSKAPNEVIFPAPGASFKRAAPGHHRYGCDCV